MTKQAIFLIYVEAEAYEKVYSDPGLNVLGLAVFPSAQDVDRSAVDGAIRSSCSKNITMPLFV